MGAMNGAMKASSKSQARPRAEPVPQYSAPQAGLFGNWFLMPTSHPSRVQPSKVPLTGSGVRSAATRVLMGSQVELILRRD